MQLFSRDSGLLSSKWPIPDSLRSTSTIKTRELPTSCSRKDAFAMVHQTFISTVTLRSFSVFFLYSCCWRIASQFVGNALPWWWRQLFRFVTWRQKRTRRYCQPVDAGNIAWRNVENISRHSGSWNSQVSNGTNSQSSQCTPYSSHFWQNIQL